MNKVISLLFFTLRELAGLRIYQLLLALMLLLPCLLLIPTSLFMLDLGKVFIDLLFASLHAWLLLYIFFLAAPLLAKDIEQGTCCMFLTLPMSRGQYFSGRFVGIVAATLPLLLAYIVAASLAFFIAAQIWPGYVEIDSINDLILGCIFILLPYIALIAVLFLIASRATGLPEITVFLFSVWLMCWSLPPVLEALTHAQVAAQSPAWITSMLEIFNQFLPALSSSKISLYLAHALPLPGLSMLAYCAQHLAYSALALLIAIALFQHRDLT